MPVNGGQKYIGRPCSYLDKDVGLYSCRYPAIYIYTLHCSWIALIALPFVNKKFYENAIFRKGKFLVLGSGLFFICCMIAFSYKMIIQTWQLILICAAVGTGIFLYRKVRDFKSEVLSEAEKL
jgi:hypothetical protein